MNNMELIIESIIDDNILTTIEELADMAFSDEINQKTELDIYIIQSKNSPYSKESFLISCF